MSTIFRWPLLRTFLGDPQAQVGSLRKIAVVTDVRAPGFGEALPELIAEVSRPVPYELILLYLEAAEASLVRRYSETRRSHPLGEGSRPVVDGIRREIALLAELRGHADRIFDTTNWSVHDVRREVRSEFAAHGDAKADLLVSILSFGFKHGLPHGSDLVFDVRFLPNPYFHPTLRQQTGQDPEVLAFLDDKQDFGEFVDRLEDFLLFLLPRYREEHRSYLSVAIGCTGGRHRSVATAERVAARLKSKGWNSRLQHRDLAR